MHTVHAARVPRRPGLKQGPPTPADIDEGEAIVLVIDDDSSMRAALDGLLRSAGLRVKIFASTAEFMRTTLPSAPTCLVLDIRLPGVSGLDFQVELAAAGIHIPIIFMTGYGDIPMSVQAMKAGAVDFLTKPFRHQEMIDAVSRALATDRQRRSERKTVSELRLFYESLTVREREVIVLVSSGLRNKRIAAELGISEITVKVHRLHVMRKMQARSLADLVRIADALELSGRRTGGL
jgi:FixJ family two-component response regulator